MKIQSFFTKIALAIVIPIILVSGIASAAPNFTSSLVQNATVGDSFSYTITTDDATVVVYGSSRLPSGLSRSGNTISGTPTQSGVFTITLSATNEADETGTAVLELTISDGEPVITSDLFVQGRVGIPLTYNIEATNSPTSFTAVGLTAIGGLTINSSNGEITGTPNNEGEFDVRVRATNSAGTGSAFVTFSILPTGAPTITSDLNVTTVKGQAFSYTIETDDPNIVSISTTSLPDGLSRASGSAVISGIPTTAGIKTIDITVVNEAGEETTETLTITITEPQPVITSAPDVIGVVDQAFNYRITATNAPTTFSAIGLNAIGGLALNSVTGQITGQPQNSGRFDVVVRATNDEGLTGSRTVTFDILPALPPSIPSPNAPTVNVSTPSVGQFFEGDTGQIAIEASVTGGIGNVERVFVEWINPPATAGQPTFILAALQQSAADPTIYEGVVNTGFNPNDRQLGGGDIQLRVVAFTDSATDSSDYGEDTVRFRIAPIMEYVFPSDQFSTDGIAEGDIFGAVRISTNDFKEVRARIAGESIVDTVIIDDNTAFPNGIFTFIASQRIDFPGIYNVIIRAEDNDGRITRLERAIRITDTLAEPVAVITSPAPGFTNEVFSPASLQFFKRVISTVSEEGIIVGFDVTYDLQLISSGQGYFPRNSENSTIFATNARGVTIGVPGVRINSGRVELPNSITIRYNRRPDGTDPERWGNQGVAIMDDLSDPGRNGWVSVSADFFQANSRLESYRLFVNGEDVTPGSGNLNPDNGLVNVPSVFYPGPGRGAPLPGDYIIIAQVTDRQGEVGTSEPVTFRIKPFDPFVLSIQRANSGDALQGIREDFIVNIEPLNNVDVVEIVDAVSGDVFGEARLVESAGTADYRFATVFNRVGSYSIFARVTGLNGQKAQSNPVEFEVLRLNDLTVEITEPDPVVDPDFPGADSVIFRGQTLNFVAEAEASPGVEFVEWFEQSSIPGQGEISLGRITEGAFTLSRTFDSVGTFQITARARDNLGNSRSTPNFNVRVRPSSEATVVVELLDDNNIALAGPLSLIQGDSVFARAAVTADVNVASVEWFVDDEPVTTQTEGDFELNQQFTGVGSFELKAVATDQFGNTADAVVNINVAQADISVELVDDNNIALAGPLSLIQGDSVFARAAVTADVNVASVEWFVDDEPVTTQTEGDFELNQQFTGVGSFELKAVATDQFGNTAEDAVNIDVAQADISFNLERSPTGSIFQGDSVIFRIENLSSDWPIAALAWELNGVEILRQTPIPGGPADPTLSPFSLNRSFPDSGVFVVRARAIDQFNNVSSPREATIVVNPPNPFARDEIFVEEVFNRLLGRDPSSRELADALAALDGSFDAKVDFTTQLISGSAFETAEIAGLIYRMMTGEWPDSAALALALATLVGEDGMVGDINSLTVSLIPAYNERFAVLNTDIGFIRQVFRNKHAGSSPTALSEVRLLNSLTGGAQILEGSGGRVIPGYNGDLVSFATQFALDNEKSSFTDPNNLPLSNIHLYAMPNDPRPKARIAILVSGLVGEDPTDAKVNSYSGNLRQIVATILNEWKDGLPDPAGGLPAPLANSVRLSNGWYQSPWLGEFNLAPGAIFSNNLGWMDNVEENLVAGQPDGRLRFDWRVEGGLTLLGSETQKDWFEEAANPGRWIYVLPSTTLERWYFDTADRTWKTFTP